jgi:exosortase
MISSMNGREGAAVPRVGFPWVTLFLVSLWTWGIWSCAEHWRGNPNYSYGWAVPLLALGFGLRRYLFLDGASEVLPESLAGWVAFGMAAVLGILAFGLEYAREDMWHPVIILWTICLVCTGLTLVVFRRCGGFSLARAEAFPVLFFLTAVPWPPRFEQPLTGGLMSSVASATTEVLHWLGIEAQSSGGAIALRSGLVGITEACSGIRSLQAGMMFGLAMGEWFLLRPGRRIFLLAVAIGLALLTNLARTLTLALQAERHGAGTVEQVHDLVGNVVMTSLVLAIWLIGKFLSRRSDDAVFFSNEAKERVRRLLHNASVQRGGAFALAFVALVAGIFSARLVYARADAMAYVQTAPRFIAQTGAATSNRLAEVPPEVWKELHPTSGEYVQRHDPGAAGSSGDCFHFFWKPSVWNRFVLVHRPDICMPGIGWQSTGPAEPVDLDFDGRSVRFYLFRFRRGNMHALELWGAWRNGDPVPLDYTPAQVFGAAPPPGSLHLEGKRRSATEIVACNVMADGSEPAKEIAVALLRSVFHYKADE